MRIKLILFFAIFLSTCSQLEPITINEIISGVDNVLIRSSNRKGPCLSSFLDIKDISFLKDTIGNTYKILDSMQINPMHYLTLYESDSIIGFISIDSASGNIIRFKNHEFSVIVQLSYNLGGFFDELTNLKNIDCNDSYKRVWINTISVRDYIEILRVKNPVPNKTHFLSIWGNVDPNWITKEDVAYMIPLMDISDTAYCTGSPLSSHGFDGSNDYSTLGGQIMNLIDYYRLDNAASFFHPSCYKNDSIRKAEILNWWNMEQ